MPFVRISVTHDVSDHHLQQVADATHRAFGNGLAQYA